MTQLSKCFQRNHMLMDYSNFTREEWVKSWRQVRINERSGTLPDVKNLVEYKAYFVLSDRKLSGTGKFDQSSKLNLKAKKLVERILSEMA